jgi:hypothetical protein
LPGKKGDPGLLGETGMTGNPGQTGSPGVKGTKKIYISNVLSCYGQSRRWGSKKLYIQCNLDLVTLLVSAKTVTKSNNVTKSNDFM